MKRNRQLLVCLLFLWVMHPLNSDAQKRDSSLAEKPIQIQPFGQEHSDANIFDSILQKRPIKDSSQIIKWKRSREFSYMHYLDSLLRKQKDLRTDTVSIDEKSGRINRIRLPARHPSALKSILNSWPLKLFFWSLALIFIVLISYKVFFSNGIFTTRKKTVEEYDAESHQELNEISKYDALIGEAENKEQFSLAIRYLFLKTLKNLSDRNIINFTAEKTNKEYLREMETNNLLLEFRQLTYNYEYIWYGKFQIGKEEYRKLRKQFDSFNTKI